MLFFNNKRAVFLFNCPFATIIASNDAFHLLIYRTHKTSHFTNFECYEFAMLTDEELEYLNDYHATVFKSLSPYLDDEMVEWLADACTPITR